MMRAVDEATTERTLDDRHLRFGDFRFFEDTGELYRGDERVHLGPKPTVVLGLLVAHPGRLVLRQHFYDAVWPRTLVEFDQGLNACVRQVRKALGDDARNPRFIETVPRRGYRFIHPVERGDDRRRRWMPVRRRWPGRPVLLGLLALTLSAWGLHAPSPTRPVLARVDFALAADSPELSGLDLEMEREVQAQFRRLHASERLRPADQRLFVTGTLSEAEDGALLRALVIRASDGAVVWKGDFNPLCARARDPKTQIGAYLAGVLARSAPSTPRG